MDLADFHYDLPAELIAQEPLAERAASRLLVVDGTCGAIEDDLFSGLVEHLAPGDLLVFNDTRVIPARLRGRKAESGGRVEVLIERITADGHSADCHVRASKAPRIGTALVLAEGAVRAVVTARRDDLFTLDFGAGRAVGDLLEAHGEMPLPPYIGRAADARDRERYQTVYARASGAVAAPTAGLHFDGPMLARLAE